MIEGWALHYHWLSVSRAAVRLCIHHCSLYFLTEAGSGFCPWYERRDFEGRVAMSVSSNSRSQFSLGASALPRHGLSTVFTVPGIDESPSVERAPDPVGGQPADP